MLPSVAFPRLSIVRTDRVLGQGWNQASKVSEISVIKTGKSPLGQIFDENVPLYITRLSDGGEWGVHVMLCLVMLVTRIGAKPPFLYQGIKKLAALVITSFA